MERYQMRVIAWLVYFSVAALILPAIYYGIRWLTKPKSCECCKKTGISKMLIFSGWLLGAVWCLRYAVGYFSIITANSCTDSLTWWEEISNSLVHTLQTFSMDEDYTAYILDGKAMMTTVFGENTFYPTAYGIYASVLNCVAPVAGGAIVFEMLASIFPKLRLWGSYWLFFRKKYFFSELNAASLALAKDIRRTRRSELPVLIFTDAYTEDGSEKDHELMLEALQQGAICLRDDVVHVSKPWWGRQEYYLMDENEFGNLQALMDLTDRDHVRALKNASIYLFVQSDAYVQLEIQVYRKLERLREEGVIRKDRQPRIVPVNGYRNLVHNLLTEVPLYEPLVHKAEPENLSVTVMGNGTIGTEAFLSVYWFSQMLTKRGNKLTPCKVTVNVVSQDTEQAFWEKIGYINPEIRQTVQDLGEDDLQAKQLLQCDDTHTNPPYCAVRYIQADIKQGSFMDGETAEARQVLGSDYFIVALGSDADNISVAQMLRRTIGKLHIETETADAAGSSVIAYAVFDENLAKTLNEHKRYQLRDGVRTDLYMHAFGSLEQVYSCDNVYMSKDALWAEETGAAYESILRDGSHMADNQSRAKGGENSDYNYWANLARAAHVKYKVFSLGWIESSVFDHYADRVRLDEAGRVVPWEEKDAPGNQTLPLVPADELHKADIRQSCSLYRFLAVSAQPCKGEKARKLQLELEEKKHLLAWLEHRRWNAFTRTMGYRYTPADKLFAVKGTQKDMPLKLHSCLVEARWPAENPGEVYLFGEFGADGRVDRTGTFREEDRQKQDRLDRVSWARFDRVKDRWAEDHNGQALPAKDYPDDFKMYDYYRHEFSDCLTAGELAKALGIDEGRIVKMCRPPRNRLDRFGKLRGAAYFALEDTWYIPEEVGRKLRKKK